MSSSESDYKSGDSSDSNVNTTEDKSDQYSSEGEFEQHFIEGDKFEFKVDISKETIFEVHRVLSGMKYRKKVKKGNWPTLLNEKIWEKFQSNCSWSFKRADVVSDEVTVVGNCSFKACNARIRVQTSDKLSMLQINIDNFDGNILHKDNKRRLTGKSKNEIDKMLEDSSAFKVHKKLVKNTMKPGDVEPAHLPTMNALRISKSRSQLKDRDKNPYQSLSSMSEYEFRRTIHYIGFNPFYVIYSTPLQRKWYRSQTKNSRSIVSIDATGLQQTIFFYAIILNGIVPFPVGQMLSQDQTMSFLVFWLSNWSFNNKFPDEIHLDQSAALFGACIKAFTNYKSTNAYISVCMDSLLNETPPPKIFLRIDRYHFVCTIHRIKQFKKMDPLKVGLFKAVFGALILCADLPAVKKIIIDLFIIMRSRYITETCERSLLDLRTLCEKHEILIEEEEKSDDNDDLYMEENSIEATDHGSYKETSSYRLKL